MEQFDRKKIDKELKKIQRKYFINYFKNFYHLFRRSGNLAFFGYELYQSMTQKDNFDNIVLACLFGCFDWNYTLEYYNEKADFLKNAKRNLMRNTHEYRNCLESYKQLIKETADLIGRHNFEDPLDVAIYYTQLYCTGFISIGGEFEYSLDFKENNSGLSELTGARVCSGKAVCRHIASFLDDLYNEMGYDSSYITLAHHSFFWSDFLRNTHAAVAVNSDKGKFCFDPTNMTALNFDKNSKKAIDALNESCSYYCRDANHFSGIDKVAGVLYEIMKNDNRSISKEELLDHSCKVGICMSEDIAQGLLDKYVMNIFPLVESVSKNEMVINEVSFEEPVKKRLKFGKKH